MAWTSAVWSFRPELWLGQLRIVAVPAVSLQQLYLKSFPDFATSRVRGFLYGIELRCFSWSKRLQPATYSLFSVILFSEMSPRVEMNFKRLSPMSGAGTNREDDLLSIPIANRSSSTGTELTSCPPGLCWRRWLANIAIGTCSSAYRSIAFFFSQAVRLTWAASSQLGRRTTCPPLSLERWGPGGARWGMFVQRQESCTLRPWVGQRIYGPLLKFLTSWLTCPEMFHWSLAVDSWQLVALALWIIMIWICSKRFGVESSEHMLGLCLCHFFFLGASSEHYLVFWCFLHGRCWHSMA